MVVELDVRDHGDLRAQAARASGPTRPPRRRASRRPRARCRRAAAPRRRSRNDGSSPSRSRQNAIIAAVVVLPCAPATTIDGRSATSSASSSPRLLTSRPAISGLSGAIALETITSPPSGTLRSRGRSRPERRRLEPLDVRGARAVRAADLRPPRARDERERAHPGAADPDEPEAPTLEQARSAPRRSRRPRPGARRAASPRPSPSGARVVEQRAHDLGHAAEVGLRDEDRPARVLEVARVPGLVVGGRVRVRDEDRRLPGRGELPDASARAREDEVGGARARARSRRETAAAGSRAATRGPAAPRARARRRGGGRPALTRRSSRRRARSARGRPGFRRATSSSGPSAGSSNSARAQSRGTGRERAGIGRPVTRYFGPVRPEIGNARNTRLANGAASRFASPRCASASVSAHGIRRRAAASTIGPPTYPPPPSTTSGFRRARIRSHAAGEPTARRAARAWASPGWRGRPLTRNVSSS